MKLLLHDANVLIDLITAGLLDITFRLPYVMETTDFVVREIVPKDQRKAIQRIIDAEMLTVCNATAGLVGEIARLHHDIPALSIADCSVVCHALATGAVVLTGDGLLRKTAKAKSLNVHGTLWVLQQLVSENLITPNEAIVKLTELMKKNIRLPKHECSRLIELWMALTLR